MNDKNSNIEKKEKAVKDARILLSGLFLFFAALGSYVAMMVFNYAYSSFVSFNPITSPQALAVYLIESIALISFIRLLIKDRNYGLGKFISLAVMSIAPILLTNFPKYVNILTNTANIGNFFAAISPIICIIFFPLLSCIILKAKGAKFFPSDTGLETCKEESKETIPANPDYVTAENVEPKEKKVDQNSQGNSEVTVEHGNNPVSLTGSEETISTNTDNSTAVNVEPKV